MIINIFALKTSKKRQPVLDHLVEKNTEKAPGKPGSAPKMTLAADDGRWKEFL
jgi:hypothetical protein